jgi:hypothetical protein
MGGDLLMLKTPHRAKYVIITHTVENRRRVTKESGAQDGRFLIEPLRSRDRASIMARIPSAARTISWAPPLELKDGDKVIHDGKTFFINEVTPDIYRGRWPYFTAIGSEKYRNA